MQITPGATPGTINLADGGDQKRSLALRPLQCTVSINSQHVVDNLRDDPFKVAGKWLFAMAGIEPMGFKGL
jgi:L-lactate utilization protein LutC